MAGPLVPERSRRPTLADRYELDEGRVLLTGVQALVRVLVEQHRADARAGLRTATLVSGYQGSPLAGFDIEVRRLGRLASELEIVLRPAVNEELGATAVWGSQLAGTLPGPRFDGVLGVWYGKAPGVDRAADAIRHGNFVGTDPRGGALALCGDDPACKSSTVPSASESLLAALRVPVFVPGSVQEVVDLGRHAIACSRASGLWSAMKMVTNVADAFATAEVSHDRVSPVVPQVEWEGRPYVHRPSAHLLAPPSLQMERTLVGPRLTLAKLYARLNGLNRLVLDAPGARVGVVAAGIAAHDVLSALSELGLGEDAPLRLLQVGMLYPLDEEAIRGFASGLDEVLVIEEKGPFLERAVRDALYGSAATPPVLGQQDSDGAPLVPAAGTLGPDAIARIVGKRLLAHEDLPALRAGLDRLEAMTARPRIELGATRTPFFCSGCPHNSSLVAEDDAIVGAGIGCHTLVMLANGHHGQITGITQMGGEGAQWIGVAPFSGVPHFVQNLGDGTFHHSGSLAIRAAVAAGINITYKLLVNGYVAMTGGQAVVGEMDVPALVRSLEADGVRRIVITTEEPSRYARAGLPALAEVRHRSAILDTQRELAGVEGVTVLLHDQACAAELRRARKRGSAPTPKERVLINERVCEGCGDCGEKSSCLSVEPVETEFGRKTQINQTSCNHDRTCLRGDCPSFITIVTPETAAGAANGNGARIAGANGASAAASAGPPLPPIELPEPDLDAERELVRVRLVGIGGTGVVTVSQVLGAAALLDGRHASGRDQTGLSQKAGPVISDVVITAQPLAASSTPPAASVDLLLALDLVGTVGSAVLGVADPARTVVVASDYISPTARMIVDVDAGAPDVAVARAAIDAVSRAQDNVYVDAHTIAETLLGGETYANVVVLGAAWQSGALPLSLDAMTEAWRLNGVAVDANLAAFAWGRAWVADPDAVRAALPPTRLGAASVEDAPVATLEPAAVEGVPAAALAPAPPAGTTAAPDLTSAARALVDRMAPGGGELRRLLEVRVADLLGWGGIRAATGYVEAIARVRAVEAERIPESTAFTEAVARGLHKFTAYKDEYEVARLHVEGLASLPPGAKPTFHLHPPLLRAMGMQRKMKLGPWFVPALRALEHGRPLRGTKLDPFGYSRVRRVERELPGEYTALIETVLPRLSPATLEIALEIAALPELARGYEEIKLAGVARFRARATELTTQLLAEKPAAEPAAV